MIIISILLFATFLTQSSIQTDLYKSSIELINDSKEYLEFDSESRGFHVSKEVLSIDAFAAFFSKELDPYFESPMNNSDQIHYKLVTTNKNLRDLSTCKSSKNQLFFSQINNNVFFAELINGSKKRFCYQNRPSYGTTLIYLFVVLDSKVTLLSVKEIAYN